MPSCAAGEKLCDGACVDVDDPAFGCDPTLCSAEACPDMPGAVLACDAGRCVIGSCGDGTKQCEDRCVSLTDPAYGCGATTCDASACPSQGTGATLVCEGSACVVDTCPANYKKCDNKCVAISDPTYGCGATTCDASSCPAAGSGTLVCQDSACVIGTCGAGTKKCGSNCVTADANNGCADTSRCTACANNEACSGSPTKCQCVPTPLATACSGKCGTVSNGCGGTYSCGGCTSPQTCGGGGTANVCGCTPTAMGTACAGKCGTVPNGCGGTYSCGGCTSPQTCGGGGTANVCGCTPAAMATACSGKSCGSVSNGCGGTYTCGTCGGATPNCVSNQCVCTAIPKGTACSGKACGTASDGCGGTYTCGTCDGTIPACKNGTVCVECTTDAHCTAQGYKTCVQSTDSCVCAQKSSANRMTNPGFDLSLDGWSYQSSFVKWDSADADNCSRSGSVKITPGSATMKQCVSVSNAAGKSFTLGYKYKQDKANSAICYMSFSTNSTCTQGAGPDFVGVSSGNGVSTANWQSASGSGVALAGTTHLNIQCQLLNSTATIWFDQLYVTQGSGSF